MPPDADRSRVTEARARFDRPELAPLWRALRARLEHGSGPVTRVTIRLETPEQRAALADLLGLARLPDAIARARVEQLDRALLDSPAGLDARGVVEAIGGPIVDRGASREADRRARDELWAWLAAHRSVAAEPALAAWVAYARGNGVIGGSVERTRALLEHALAVLGALPADGQALSSLADLVCGDPHALDDGRRLSAYVLRALACLLDTQVPATAEERRLLWERVGVACGALSTTVLTAGLRPAGDATLPTTLRAWSDAGQAAQVTLAQLRMSPVEAVTHRIVWTVENPAVVAAALLRFGSRCPPTVCASGWPNTAVIELLRQLGRAGPRIMYHGDLDGEGLRIASYVVARTGATPWRMTAADYLAVVAESGTPAGRVPDVPWDAGLGAAIRARDVTVSEERVTEILLNDMTAHSQLRSAPIDADHVLADDPSPPLPVGNRRWSSKGPGVSQGVP